jgi:hypothetical protein
VTLTMNGLQARFPIQLLRAFGHPLDNTIAGTALPYAQVWSLACHYDCHALETDADAAAR